MKAIAIILISIVSLLSPLSSSEEVKWELVVLTYSRKTGKENTIVNYFSSYWELKEKMEYIQRTHRPKGSVRRLLYREKANEPYYVIMVSR